MKRNGKGFSPHQLSIDWASNVSSPTTQSANSHRIPQPGDPIAGDTRSAPKSELSPANAGQTDLVQRLPWDFLTRFPEPLPDAIEVGAIHEADTSFEGIQSFHDEMSRQLLQVLVEQDTQCDRRRTVPGTQANPTSQNAGEKLSQDYHSELDRLQRHWQSLLGAYEAAFGDEAADAFVKAVRARHSGVRVELAPFPMANSVKAESPVPTCKAASGSQAENPHGNAASRIRKQRRMSARLPLPRPLALAVKAGHFGHNEGGPVNPSADEVREITEAHAAELIDLLADMKETQSRGLDARALAARAADIDSAVRKYAEDFGEQPAEQLLAYCRRQVLIDSDMSAMAPQKRR